MNKETELIGKEIAKKLAAAYIQEPYLSEIGKRYSALGAILAGVSARILGMEELVIEYEKFIKLATPQDLKLHNNGSNKIKGMKEIDKKYPVYSKEKVMQKISRDTILKHCLKEEHDYARSLCESEFNFEELACAQSVLGQFDEAEKTVEQIVEDEFRVNSIRSIKTIELWRYGHHKQARELLSQLEDKMVIPFLALGFLNREPWQVYPFPDL